MKKVLIGVSGGVDSSVAALLLKKQGYEVAGVTFKLWGDKTSANERDIQDAKKVCEALGIKHFVFDYKELFKNEVIDYFVSEYKKGRTPNPCIICNKKIKFEAFLNSALEMGYDYIATGHYAFTKYNKETKRYELIQAKSDKKDQSYVLYSLTQEQLSHTLFPLGEYSKEQVRQIAADNNLLVSNKPDSQDICFIPDGNYENFLLNYTGEKCPEGNFKDVKGNIIGKHLGLWHYTIGQRKGLGMAFGKPMFVMDISPEDNSVTLADDNEIFSDTLYTEKANLIAIDNLTEPIKLTAKIRYSHPKAKATLYPMENGELKVIFDEPQRAVTKGQAIVFYDGASVFGGAIIK